MKKIIKKGFYGLISSFVLAVSTLAAPSDYGIDDGSGIKVNQGGLKENIIFIVNGFLGFLGIIAVVMIIYAGVLMVTAQGEEEQITKGKKIITWAAIGIVVIMLSFAIVKAVTSLGSNDTTG